MRCDPVLFDLDGTVVDSGAIILASLRHATKTVLGETIPDERLLATVGGSGLASQMRDFAPDRVDELVRVYTEHNGPLHAELAACDGMLELLGDLKADGRRLGIVTAKRRKTVQLAFETLPIERLFDVVVAGDETDRQKPHPEPLLRALAQLGARTTTAAYVGDSPFDIQAAKAGGLTAIAATWGRIHNRDRLEQEEPDHIVETPEELRAVLG
ncbi:MAG TPA: HAD-IA family hydrolase [Gaiellaceae bacterium]|nr:HAD-IA family hydrolase [Gaiellaceae bacterium]